MNTPSFPLSRLAAMVVLCACPAAAPKLLAQNLLAVGGDADLDSVLRSPSVIESSGLPNGWFRAEYLMWWTDGTALPPLVTSSPAGTPPAQAGVLGTPGAEVLFGNESVNDEMRNGGRIGLGLGRDRAQTVGLELDFVFLTGGDDSSDFAAASAGDVILARPFFNPAAGQEDAVRIAFPNVVAGGVRVDNTTDLFSGAVLVRSALRQGPDGRMDLLAGYRYLRFREALAVRENLVSLDPGGWAPQGTSFNISDRLETENDFHGAEIGLVGEFYRSFLSLEAAARMAVGNVHETLEISGETVVAMPGNPATTTPGGLLARPTNLGRRTRDDFAFLPQLDLHLKALVSDNFSVTLGYTWLYLSEALRVGEQIDRSINPTALITPEQPGGAFMGEARPAARMRESDFWAHGIGLGGEIIW